MAPVARRVLEVARKVLVASGVVRTVPSPLEVVEKVLVVAGSASGEVLVASGVGVLITFEIVLIVSELAERVLVA